MNNICGIYKITSPSNKVYIGQSLDIYSRFLKYKSLHCKKQFRIYNSLIKYGWEAHIFEIVEECKSNELDCSERFWQDFYNVLDNDKGLNCVLTECGEQKRILSEELKNRISETTKNKIISEEVRLKMSNSKKGVPKSEETKKKMSERQIGKLNHFYGKKFTQEHKDKIAIGNTGKVLSEETKIKLRDSKLGQNNTTSKLVLDLTTGIFYYCIREAAEAYNLNYKKLRDQLNSDKNPTNLIKV